MPLCGGIEVEAPFDIRLELTARVDPASPRIWRSADDGGEPAWPAEVTEVSVTGLFTHTYDAATKTFTPIDLLKGVDRSSAAYKQLVTNMIDALGDHAWYVLEEQAVA